ncbi:hypothetical protein D3C85_1036980 [compost metagenome]
MQIGQVREVEQIVMYELVVGIVIHKAMAEDPRRIIQSHCRRYEIWIRFSLIPQPNPNPVVALNHCEAAHASLRWNAILPGNFYTLAGLIKAQPMVEAS